MYLLTLISSTILGRSSTSQIRNYFDAEFSVKASPKSSSIATPVRSSSAPPRNSNRREVDSSPQSSDVSDIILGRGLEFRKQGNFESAIKEYTKVLARNPRHFKAFFNRAFALDKLGKYEQAIEDYSAAIDLDNSNPYVIFNRGILYDKTGNLIDAEKDFHAAVFLQNQNPEFLFNLAFCLKRLGRFNDAISVYTKCIRIQPNNLKAICSKGDCFEKIGCPDMALKEYNHALSKLPQYVPALCGRAKIFADRAGTDNSQAAYRDYSVALSVAQLSEFKGDLPEIFMQRAKVQEAMGNMELAISDLNSGISLLLTNIAKSSQSSHSNHMLRIRTSELLVYRLQLFKGLENFSKAKDDCTEVITLLSPIDGTSRSDGISCTLCDSERKKIIDLITTVLLGRGQCFRKANCIQQAINDYSEIIRFDSHNIKAFNNRAYCYAKLLQYEKAISDYTAVISLDPLNSHAFHNRGISFDKLGDKESALADFAKVNYLFSYSLPSLHFLVGISSRFI
jgi:tetratricopeptide (TPR) repeat protein